MNEILLKVRKKIESQNQKQGLVILKSRNVQLKTYQTYLILGQAGNKEKQEKMTAVFLKVFLPRLLNFRHIRKLTRQFSA